MGLLDFLTAPDTGNGAGGLLSYLQSPLYPSPLQAKPEDTTKSFLDALRAGGETGSMVPASGSSIWDRPGINYAPMPAPSVFDVGSGTNLGGWTPGQQGAPQAPAAPQQPPAPPQAMPVPAAASPPQASPIAIGNYQTPRIGNADLYQPQATLPANAQPTQGQLTQAQASASPQVLPSFLSNQGGLGAGVSGFVNNLHTGPLGAIVGGIGSALGMQNPAQQNLRAQFEATRQALIANGVPAQQASSTAMLSVLNPEAAKTVLPELLTNKEKYQVISENPVEGKKYGFVNDREQTINGKPIGEGASGGPGGPGLLASGVAQYNPNLSGNDYMAQFSPEVQAAAKAYMNGDVLPSGNSRQQGIATMAKTVAQKYGADLGIPVSDALYSEKRKYRTELGSNSPNTAGGQAKAFNQGINHLSDLADNLEKLDNSNGLGIPLLAQGVNAMRQGVSNQQSAIADEAKSLGQTVAGEVGKLFSGSAGGGVHERELTRERFDTVKSRPQLAAALRATIETMQGGLSAIEQNRDRILGPNNGVDLVNQDTRDKITKIQGVIDRLEGRQSSGSAPTIQEGATATNPQTGQKIVFRNGKWQ